MITSPQNPKIKLIRALQSRAKARRKEGAFIVEGVRLFEEAVKAKWEIRFILYDRTLSERGRELLQTLENIEIEEIDSALLKSISDTETSQGIFALLDHSPLPIPDSSDFLLIPDQVRDPGNLGTLIRTAAAAGVDAVILPPGTTDSFAPKVLRAGMGAHFRMPIVSMDWDEIKAQVQALTVFLAEMEGDVVYTEASLKQACAVIIGGEAEGASQSARDLADADIYIPMKDKTESLNAALAGAILLFEVVKQRSL
ncbi:MAG: RNA methyltransferase [Anaerolineae bacterium]|jgi:RNA methyltransferase, TrmH family|nr:RNA methyltransferase [Anaerolineae bacterium]MBT7188991.1 RNA methyltransferase [Anaerolineae bacterium]MBT7990258.1 RNA methyltransferase [Anaerolineae bacterium]